MTKMDACSQDVYTSLLYINSLLIGILTYLKATPVFLAAEKPLTAVFFTAIVTAIFKADILNFQIFPLFLSSCVDDAVCISLVLV